MPALIERAFFVGSSFILGLNFYFVSFDSYIVGIYC